MKNELEQKANIILDMVIKGVEKGVEQMPMLTEEYLTYFMIEELPIVSAIGFLATFSLGLFICIRTSNEKNGDGFFGGCLVIFISVILSTFIYCGIKNIIQIKLAPKAYLIEKVRK